MRQMMAPLFTLALGTFFWASTATAGNYALDATHSKVGFSVEYMMFSSTHGKFDAFTIDANLNEKDLSKSTVSVIIDATSINTENAKRDGHLKSPDFFDAATYPELKFVSSSLVKDGKAWKLNGNLTMRGVTKPVTLKAEISDTIKNPWGQQVRGVKVRGALKRSEFGLKWNKALETGGVLVSDEVVLEIDLTLKKK